VFKRTSFSNAYVRKAHTYDEFFAGVLGMSAAFSLVAVIFCSHYNKWASQEMIIS